MTSVDRHSLVNVPVTDLAAHTQPSLNQQIYLRLRLALSLNLRRQVFIAVCDDAALRDQLATQLESDLASPTIDLTVAPASQNSSSNGRAIAPRLVNLKLNLDNPDLVAQIADWLCHPENPIHTAWIPHFQITGIDQLTRQPVYVQRSFLNSLVALAQQVPTLEFNLLLWVTRPWCRSIQQSAPEFWHWHSAIFEFEGDLFDHTRVERIPVEAVRPVAIAPNGQAKMAQKPSVPMDEKLTDWVIAAVMKTVDLPDQQILAQGVDETHPDLEPLRLLQQIESLHAQQASLDQIALGYRQLGDWYRNRLDPVHPSQSDLAIVIRSYERVLKLIDAKSEQVPDLLNDIGNLYWMKARGRDGESVVNLEKALKAYQFALARTSPEQQSQTYAMIQNNLGSVYSDLAQHQDACENYQHAIAAYQHSLEYRSLETDAARYAATQNNLGTAYWNLAQHQEPVLNLQQAIAAYNEALRYYNPEQEPLHYGMLQNNLGTAYWNLAQCEQATNELAMAEDFLRLAIGAYRVALVYRTLEAAPVAYAATQNNLGTAYWHLASQHSIHSEERPTYWLCAIDAYEEALGAAQYLAAASTPYAPPLSFDVAAAEHHLGLTYYQAAMTDQSPLNPTERIDFLKRSLQRQVQAAQGWQNKPEIQPNAIAAMIQVVRGLNDRDGVQGQTWALSNIPAAYLSMVMKEL